MKRRFCSFFAAISSVLVFALGLAACGVPHPELDAKPESTTQAFEERRVAPDAETQEYAGEMLTQAEFVKRFDSVENLQADATLIIEGIVKSTTVHRHVASEDDAVPYTLFEVEATNTISGQVETGSTVLVAEYGGVLPLSQTGLAGKFPEETEENGNQQVLISFGNHLAEVGQQLLLFLTNKPGYQILDVDTPYYMLVGEYNGKFILDAENRYVQDIPGHIAQNAAQPLVLDTALRTIR